MQKKGKNKKKSSHTTFLFRVRVFSQQRPAAATVATELSFRWHSKFLAEKMRISLSKLIRFFNILAAIPVHRQIVKSLEEEIAWIQQSIMRSFHALSALSLPPFCSIPRWFDYDKKELSTLAAPNITDENRIAFTVSKCYYCCCFKSSNPPFSHSQFTIKESNNKTVQQSNRKQ